MLCAVLSLIRSLSVCSSYPGGWGDGMTAGGVQHEDQNGDGNALAAVGGTIVYDSGEGN